ncbi:MAG TPA: hypothetical protein VIL86_11670 [Tepidisphaeraceae bacterium]|jgi:hypothetical protein
MAIASPSNGLSSKCNDLLWSIYEAAPQICLDLAGQLLRLALPAMELRIPVMRYQGIARGGTDATIIVAGENPWLDDLVSRFFQRRPRGKLLKECPSWMLPGVLRQHASADLVLARVDRLSSRLLYGNEYYAVPEWAGAEVILPENLEELFSDTESVKSDVRKVRKNHFTSKVSYSEADFEIFYHTMHVPFVQNRHGELAYVRNIHRLRKIFRRGGLLWINQVNHPVAGLLFERCPGVFRAIVLGVAGGNTQLAQDGTLAAIYYHAFCLAHSEGTRLIDLGGTRPVLNDGILSFKRKWGARLFDKRDIFHDYLLRFDPASAAARSFLANTPLIHQDRGGLSAVVGLPASSGPATRPLGYAIPPGLRRLSVVGDGARSSEKMLQKTAPNLELRFL